MQVISVVGTTYLIQTMTNSNAGSVKLHPTHVEETTSIPTNCTLHKAKEEVTGAVGGMEYTTLIPRDRPPGMGGGGSQGHSTRWTTCQGGGRG